MTSVLQVLHDRVLETLDSIQPPERYKIVVFDAKTNKIVLSACKMFDIMDRNVTLVEMLESSRQAYSSLEAVYLLTPCSESVQRLMDDFPPDSTTGKYKAAHVLFTAPMESRVFSLESPSSFYTLYSPSKKMELAAELDSIAKQLVSVIATFGDYPSIRYFRPPETQEGKRTQAMKLAMLLQSELEAYMRSNPESAGRQQGQGTILILDRSVDVAAAIVHEFTYQAMANDLLPIEDGSKYSYEFENAQGETEKVSVVIDESDQIFMEIRHSHIVETASTLTSKFNKFVEEHESLRGDKEKVASVRNMKDQLANLPQFTDLKTKYSTHIHMAKECMKIFEKFKINEIGLVEQQLATGETVDGHLPKQVLSEMVPFLDDPVVSTMDKVRLLMLYTLCREGLRAEDRDRLFEHTKISDTNVEAIQNLAYLGVNVERGGSNPRTKRKPFYPRKRAEDEELPYDLSRYITKTKKIVEEHINGTLDVTQFPYTTEAPVDSNEARSLRKTPQATWDRKKPNVKGSRLFVFIAGGVTYSEIRAMYELCEAHGRDIIIGSTHIVTPRQFVHGLRHLARGPTRPTAPVIPPYKPPAPTPSQRPGPPSQPSSRPGAPPNSGGRAGAPPPSPHRPVTPDYRSAPGSSGGIRTIQKDASGRFVAPPAPHGNTPPSSFHGAGSGTGAGAAASAAAPEPEKKKGKMFGFI
ncbi:vacuolar sorting protein VPS33/slp1 [Mortierella sp. NVP85]|nr:vacuolar sorting protein VPS33/slp1 [Mortierella sp. NVP85]